MAGSKTWREYTSDSGVKYSIPVDESNASLFSSLDVTPLVPVRSANHKPMPQGLRPRTINCWLQSNPKKKATFIVGNPATLKYAALMDGAMYLFNPDFTQVWITTGYSGESITWPGYYGQIDTGLDDGTASQ